MGRTIHFANKLIVSCQDHEEIMLRAAKEGGAAGFRVNGLDALRLARDVDPDMPVIACWKQFRRGKMRITPDVSGACKLAEAGAEMVAFDARRSVATVGKFVRAIHERGALAVADVDEAVSGCVAIDAGADYVATTLAPRLSRVLIQGLTRGGAKVIAEGGIVTPAHAKKCIDWGAQLVVVGTAITRPKMMTERFLEAVT